MNHTGYNRAMRGAAIAWLAGVSVLVSLAGCSGEDILTSGTKLYSQGNEELVIRDFFQDRRGGVFVDVGCSHYERHSTTYYLEKHLGWSGIGLDAIPDYASDYAAHRPRTTFENYIVTNTSGTTETFHRAVREGQRGLSSIYGDLEWKGMPVESEEIQVPTITLNELLDSHGMDKLDFISIDIERSAPLALAGFDIQRFRPELVCIEASRGREYRRSLQAYFAERGYERIDEYLPHDGINWYFRPAE